jgi:adenine-specific DNA-methyltransferase
MSNEPGKVDLETPDLAQEKRAIVEALLPGVLVDGVVDATRLGELLDTPVSAVADGRERFGLMWAGKQSAVKSLLAASRAALVPQVDKSSEFDDAGHVFIEGDNLEVLKLLQKAYNDRVKLIYIDPPYNTGSNDFIYPDDFSDSLKAYLEFTGELDAGGNRTSANVDTLGRRHSRWLSMMYPRLVLARNLLTQDGVIFVSIDDNEVANLRELMDEVFGPENFVATVIWQKAYAPKNSARHFSEDHDYIVVYARNAEVWAPGLLPRTAEQDKAYKNPDNDPRGPWKSGDLSARNFYSKGTYALTSPGGRLITGPPSGRYWAVSEERFEALGKDNRIWWGPDGNGMPALKRFMSEVKQGRVPQTFWPYSEVGHNQDAKKELLKRVTFGSSDSVFNTPKPTKLIRRMLELATTTNGGDIVLDFFAGSGSTADAVLQQNADDNGNRRFILVQLPEPTGHADFGVVSDITRTRIASAMEDLGVEDLRSYRLGESSFLTEDHLGDGELFNLSPNTLREGADDVWAIAAEVFLKEGVTLDAPWTEHEFGDVVVEISDGVAIVVGSKVDDAAVQSVFNLNPRVVIFLEDDLAGKDALKANAFTNARNRGITMKTV